ncbi:Cadmium/zinc-transporting ATPase HMA2 [Apostasia shenzhenica]|uniref:Cadmium/zinc-transporting ATPase HMA2 n=1 Tax=Apostasia shenzhenica TaxID=1088818 RepID=A0A2I0AMA7_9ASPA|nr:Cadmium/zinc-transporting ATPase HMA2 [Apostasia shenzhenica]
MASEEGKTMEGRIHKSYFDVLGLCCPSEVLLIEKILKPLEGIQKVSVIIPSKTVIVLHDTLQISQLQIVNALNEARLEASIRADGGQKIISKWPNSYIIACGLLLIVSLFHKFFHPLKWLALAAVVVGLPQIIMRSIAAIRRCTLDINILMLIAVGGAVALGDYLEAGFVVFLFTMAEWLESMASHKATSGMAALMSMAPQKAILADTGQVVNAKDIKVGTVIAVKAGEVIPIDGIVVEGRGDVDERSLTGESFPIAKQPQSLVWAGTLNIDGYISVKTTALAEHSAVAKMAMLVEEAQNSRSRTQRMIDSCAKYYTPAVVLISAGVAVVPLVMRAHNQKHWLQFALVLLVSACPCALVLSTPVAIFCALLKAARTGLVVKGGDILEALAKTKIVAFDKTGTITKGEFTVVELWTLSNDVNTNTLLFWISSIESKSSHPMASALVNHARLNSIEPKPELVNDFQIYPGEGVSGDINGKKIYIGNKRIAMRAGCMEAGPVGEEIKEVVTVGYVLMGTLLVGFFTLSDTCRTGAKECIEELKSMGIKSALLTGDSVAAAMQAQKQLGDAIEEIHAELLPEDKVSRLSDLKTRVGPTTMVGDGMNDAPALAKADVGISMGVSGSAVAMETSHITLMSNDIRKIPKAIRLARSTQSKIIVNVTFSIVTKIAILGLAIGGHPLLWAAVLADVGTCLIVILNSMMLLQTKGYKEKQCHTRSNNHKINSPAQCFQEQATSKLKARDEHSVKIVCEEDSHRDESCLKHSSEAVDCGEKPDGDEIVFKTSNIWRGVVKEDAGSYRERKKEDCQRTECSSLQAGKNKRQTGACCRSYRKECMSREACCGSGMIQVPEIIID